jgi:hypothetical protein
MQLNEDEVKRLREETQISLKSMDSMLLTKTERYVLRYAREHDIETEDVREALVEMKKAQILPKEEASKLYSICILERDWLQSGN